MMSQGRALKIPDRKKQDLVRDKKRKKTEPRKNKNKAETGLEKEQGKEQERERHLAERREAHILVVGTKWCPQGTLHCRPDSFTYLRWLGLVL